MDDLPADKTSENHLPGKTEMRKIGLPRLLLIAATLILFALFAVALIPMVFGAEVYLFLLAILSFFALRFLIFTSRQKHSGLFGLTLVVIACLPAFTFAATGILIDLTILLLPDAPGRSRH
jgi:hypothetical protein